MDAAATTTVTFTVTEMERVQGAGRLSALAAIELELDGIGLTVQGVRVIRRNGRVIIEAPHYRNPRTGQWLPALILPDELGVAIAREIQRLLTTQHRAG